MIFIICQFDNVQSVKKLKYSVVGGVAHHSSVHQTNLDSHVHRRTPEMR